MSRKGFTIFELLAVLTVIGITLAVTLGSYNSWAAIHALNSAARTLEAGLLHARTTAKAKNTYVMVVYQTTVSLTNHVKSISGYQSFVCTNDTDRSVVSDVLDEYSKMDGGGAGDITDPNSDFNKQFTQIALQRLPGHVELGYIGEHGFTVTAEGVISSEPGGILIFCPDGSAWSWNDPSSHHILISSRKRFTRDNQAQPLQRILRVNLLTGMATTYRPG